MALAYSLLRSFAKENASRFLWLLSLRRTRRKLLCNFSGSSYHRSGNKKKDDHLIIFFLGGGGEIRTPATGLPVLTI